MNKVYELNQDTENFANFLEKRDNYEDSFFYKYWGFKNINLETYEPLPLKLYASDTGKKNFQTDISCITGGLFILSEKAVNVLRDILEQTGQIISVQTESKRKKFFGFYPNKKPYDGSIINFDKSILITAETGKIIRKLVLKTNYPKNDYLFTLKDHYMYGFVTEKFKKLVEDNDLKGFEYTEITVED